MLIKQTTVAFERCRILRVSHASGDLHARQDY